MVGAIDGDRDRSTEPCAGAIVFDADRRLLMIRRGRPPSQGQWSIPGGRCEAGESRSAACVREVAEETGLDVTVVRVAGSILRDGIAGTRYDITDFVCELRDRSARPVEPRAGDDADDACWASLAQLRRLDLVPGLFDCLVAWGLLPD